MKLEIKVTTKATFYNTVGFEPLCVDNVVTQIVDDKSDEYKEYERIYEDTLSKFKREDNPDEFDKNLKQHLIDKSKEVAKAKINSIQETFKKSCINKLSGYITFGGVIINIANVSAIRISDFKIEVKEV